MTKPDRGLYETLITETLDSCLRKLDTQFGAQWEPLQPPEAADRIALHLARVIQRAVDSLAEDKRAEAGITLARQVLEVIRSSLQTTDFDAERPISPGHVLHSIVGKLPDGRSETIEQPLIPLLDTTLLTNSPGEPRVGRQILAEIHSADRIDVVMAFIRQSGIEPLHQALETHCAAGRELRILTTTYTETTEQRALERLQRIGAKIRVSYDTTSTRLHAKSWLFYRKSGFSTAYIGSSNLTHSAQVSGLEWNVRISGARNPDVIDKVAAVFDGYWHYPDFRPYDHEEFLARSQAKSSTGITLILPPTELRPEPFQERLLEQIALSRQQGFHRNLLVSATGTGKTVMAALDYARLRVQLPRGRLLFVAHREEILTQSRATFCQALRDPTFGELWVSGKRPRAFEHVFASIQSLNATGLTHLPPDHFDVLIVDEFHHAAAQSYKTLLDHVKPVELLGLTATPERSDGLPILEWFDGRIAAELRLWDAIDQQRLAPFVYFGIHDGMDLREIPWRRGRGYDIEKLSNLLTGNDILARLVIKELDRRVGDLSKMRALGFCVSVAHARFMAAAFCAARIPSVAIWSDTPEKDRSQALRDLAERRVKAVFSVDLFNEGIDVPAVDTLLMLRPTDSPTLFIQQLGRGLRKSIDKAVCTVLDFVGHHRKEFRFDRRFRALLGGTRKELIDHIDAGFPFLPAGCHMELDPFAADIVLKSIRSAVPSKWREKIEALLTASSDNRDCSLERYLESSGLELEDVYSGNRSWSDLRADAGLAVAPSGPQETPLRRAVGRLLHVDDMMRIEGYRRLLSSEAAPDPTQLDERDRRLLRMLVASMVDTFAKKGTSLQEGTALIWEHQQVRAELREILGVLATRIEHLPVHLSSHPEVPLEVHARYTRIELLTAFGVGDGATAPLWQTGVYWSSKARADLLAFTLDKTSGKFSPTTRYRDYAIDQNLVHWESQSGTRADSETGLRYQQHVSMGTSVMLFARKRADDRAFYFLGPATYVRHESEQPMAITWRLQHSLTGDLFASFAAAVA
jgi:superfamily II DNA or RNA helicase/HKD family nuclease